MAGEAEENIVLEVPKDAAVNNNPSPAPKPDDNVKPPAKEPELTPEQVAAAAAKAAEETAKNKPTEDDDDDVDPDAWKEQYIQFEDPTAQSVVNMLTEAGVSPVEANSIFEEALQHDDLSKVKWDVLEARLGKDKANLARVGITDYYNREYSKNVATTNMTYETMGGKENWDKVAKWVKSTEKSDGSRKAEFDELRNGLNMGGRYAKQAAADLKTLYEADTKNSGLGASKIIKGDTPPKGGIEPISRADYVAGLKKLGDRGNPQAIAELRSRRRAGMAAGI